MKDKVYVVVVYDAFLGDTSGVSVHKTKSQAENEIKKLEKADELSGDRGMHYRILSARGSK